MKVHIIKSCEDCPSVKGMRGNIKEMIELSRVPLCCSCDPYGRRPEPGTLTYDHGVGEWRLIDTDEIPDWCPRPDVKIVAAPKQKKSSGGSGWSACRG